ncbi:SMI1/KNR4 family protein [Rummeliibacillus sp. SL167]|uniref:SMI1/KNR4 family protein n=1 Tax=Rummeliibacillus sp. SL167 TaxID=2579792 RepID=UPI0011B85268|nr:SMI1/KNR4 family protein [Rummeliibacillus sp. SL167]
MDFITVEKFIEEFRKEKDFTGGIDEEKINFIERQLNVILPKSYKWFLRKYGSGGIFGVQIIGYNFGGAAVVKTTENYRKFYGLNDGIVVIVDVDAFAYCLDTNKMNNGECPVISWDVDSGSYDSEEASNFLEFFWNYLNEMKENWEEDEKDR